MLPPVGCGWTDGRKVSPNCFCLATKNAHIMCKGLNSLYWGWSSHLQKKGSLISLPQYYWCFRNPARKPVEVKVVKIPLFTRNLSTIQTVVGWEWDFWSINKVRIPRISSLRRWKIRYQKLFLDSDIYNHPLVPGASSRDLLIPKHWRSPTTFRKGRLYHHPKKVTLAELPGRWVFLHFRYLKCLGDMWFWKKFKNIKKT